VSDASVVFFKQVDEVPWMDIATSRDKARPAQGSAARIKWMGGDAATGPWLYYIEHPAGAVVRPHKHDARRVEYVLDGEIEFFQGSDALAWHRGDTSVQGSRHRAGTVSWVPPGTVYGYRIVEASKLLHVFFENPVGRTSHIDPSGETAEHGADDRKGDA
jgi:quercetin dioxygenase-like cupin family protein